MILPSLAFTKVCKLVEQKKDSGIQILYKNMIDVYDNQGKEWLTQLPTLTAELANKHQLSDLKPVANMNFNYVTTGLQDEKPIILKLGLNKKALAKEAACLQVFAQHGAAEVLATEPGMILMERANPGTTLKKYFPDKSHSIAWRDRPTRVLSHHP